MKKIIKLKVAAASLALGFMLLSCGSTGATACAEEQAEYEKNYIATFGTTDGLDYGKYTWNDSTETCDTNQGVEG